MMEAGRWANNQKMNLASVMGDRRWDICARSRRRPASRDASDAETRLSRTASQSHYLAMRSAPSVPQLPFYRRLSSIPYLRFRPTDSCSSCVVRSFQDLKNHGNRLQPAPSSSRPAKWGAARTKRSGGKSASPARHVDVREDRYQRGLTLSREPIQRLRGGRGEMHHVGSLAGLTAKALAKQVSHIRLVVHDKDAGAHTATPALVACVRGSRMMNSVNSPTRLSTSIVPPCCWVTMS